MVPLKVVDGWSESLNVSLMAGWVTHSSLSCGPLASSELVNGGGREQKERGGRERQRDRDREVC